MKKKILLEGKYNIKWDIKFLQETQVIPKTWINKWIIIAIASDEIVILSEF